MDQDEIIKNLKDALDALDAPRPPTGDLVSVCRGFVSAAIDHIEWLEKGNNEWRDMYAITNRQRNAAQAAARIAISHLQAVLNKARTHAEQQAADTAARDWLISIGSEP